MSKQLLTGNGDRFIYGCQRNYIRFIDHGRSQNISFKFKPSSEIHEVSISEIQPQLMYARGTLIVDPIFQTVV